jgi:hypothetical protein
MTIKELREHMMACVKRNEKDLENLEPCDYYAGMLIGQNHAYKVLLDLTKEAENEDSN